MQDYERMIQGRMQTLRREIDAKQAERREIDALGNAIDEEIAAGLRELVHLEAAYPELAERTRRMLAPYRTSPETDREVLVALYNAMDGPNWLNNDNWLSDTPIGEWYGVVTDNNDRVTTLDLDDNKLIGTIPSELGNLANLETLRLGWNQLNGMIPPELGNLENLTHMQLPGNQLNGTIPPELGNLASLIILDIGRNQLSGTIPPELGNIVGLMNLCISENQLSGEIPEELGCLVNLEYLYLNRNRFTGCIPRSLKNQLDGDRLFIGGSDLGGLPFCL